MLLDLDNFKPLNDVHGHAAGNLLLQVAASRLNNCVREVGALARFGCDEVVVVLRDLHPHHQEACELALGTAEKTKSRLSALCQLTIHGEIALPILHNHTCAACVEIAIFEGHAITENDALKFVDSAMYQAEESGRNQICLYVS